jgi:hypothetical protein
LQPSAQSCIQAWLKQAFKPEDCIDRAFGKHLQTVFNTTQTQLRTVEAVLLWQTCDETVMPAVSNACFCWILNAKNGFRTINGFGGQPRSSSQFMSFGKRSNVFAVSQVGAPGLLRCE